MKKIWIAFFMVLYLALWGCKKEPAVVTPPVFYNVFVTHNSGGTVNPELVSVKAGQSTTITATPDSGYSVLSVIIDGVNQSISKNNSYIVIKNEAGSVKIKVEFVSNNFLILTSHGWKLKSEEKWRISTNTRISWFELSATDLSEVTFYTLDGYINSFQDGEITPWSGWKYNLVGKIITSGDQVFTITLLNDSNFNYEQVYKYADDQVIKYFYETAP